TLHGDTGDVSYRMPVLVRAFATRRLDERDETAPARLAHAKWTRDLTARMAVDWQREDGAVVGALLNRSSAEIEAPVAWALGHSEVPLAAAVTGSVMMCLHWTPGLRLSEAITEVAERAAETVPGPRVADAVGAGAFFAAERGELERARRLAHAAMAMSDNSNGCVPALLTLGVAAMYAGDHDESAAWFDRMAQTQQAVGEANSSLALLACYRDDLVTARHHVNVALTAAPAGSD